MKAILIQNGLQKALEGKSKKPESISDEKWDEIDLKALSAIQLCLSNEVLREVAKETTAAGLWLKLKSLYMTKSVTNRLLLKSRLHDLHLVEGKASCLLPKWQGSNRLKLFEADLQHEGSFDEAIKGCDGVFHVAASMEFSVREQSSIGSLEDYVQSNIIDPSIKGILNLLKSCTRSKSVKRVVLTSSISTITAKDNDGNWKPVVNESCQVSADYVWNTRASGWVYVLSKLLSEKAAFNFANENGLDLVSVITTTVGGPFLTSTVPSSIRVLLSPITGDPHLFPILKAVNSRMGSIGFVHIEDICNAHIFLMENPKAKGQYICCTQNCHLSKLVDLLNQDYPCSNMQRITSSENARINSEISSKKLRDLGFEYKFGVLDIIKETLRYCIECGYLPSEGE